MGVGSDKGERGYVSCSSLNHTVCHQFKATITVSLYLVLTLTQGAKSSVRNTLGPQEEFRGGVGGRASGSILLLQSEALRCFLMN